MSDTTCTHCKAPSSLFLCPDCIDVLQEAIDQLPWLLRELEVTVSRMDKLNLGVQGRGSDNPSPINLGASALGAAVEETLTRWMNVLSRANGLPFYIGTALQRAKWFGHNVELVAKHPRANEMYDEITDLTGDRDRPTKPGRLLRAIDRTVRAYAGSCPTITGRDQEGNVVECGRDLWAEEWQVDVECPTCRKANRDCQINVKSNRQRMVMERDILPEARLMEVLRDLGEPVYSDLLQRWLKQGTLRPSGYLSGTRIVEHRVSKSDARLLSLSRVRQLRWAHQQDRAAS